jgi:hypothetical protein
MRWTFLGIFGVLHLGRTSIRDEYIRKRGMFLQEKARMGLILKTQLHSLSQNIPNIRVKLRLLCCIIHSSFLLFGTRDTFDILLPPQYPHLINSIFIKSKII